MSLDAVIAVDDWGKGFSNLDLDYYRATIPTVCAWAHLVGARICAEGVETEEQWRQLQAIGVHLGQGWLFGAPAGAGVDRHLQAGAAVDA